MAPASAALPALPALPDEAIELHATASDWRAAVELAGACLTRAGAAEPRYAIEMIRMIEEHGPYVVIAPGLALAHARPGPEVLGDGLAVVTLSTPVDFGHPHNDPVHVVLALAVHSPERHLRMVAELANLFNDSDAVQRLSDADSADGVRAILGAAA
jgi:ascorbate PTS system EIIA or EIIAB component